LDAGGTPDDAARRRLAPHGRLGSHGYYCRCGELNAAALELTDEDVLFASLPLFHAGGLLIVLMSALYRGVLARFESSFSARAFFDRASVTEATVAVGVGAMGAALLASQSSTADRQHRLRTMMVAPMAPESQNRFRDRFGIEPWTEVFGQTECMPITTALAKRFHRVRGSQKGLHTPPRGEVQCCTQHATQAAHT
jgi:crotonobetaine/carnitine-CoA ligase